MTLLVSLALLLCFCISPAVFQPNQNFVNLPGTTNAEKVTNIARAVAQTRAFAAGQACFTSQFPNPADSAAISHWTAWICSFLGGPTSLDGCAWFTDFSDNTTLQNTTDDLQTELHFKHTQFPISSLMMQLFTQLLSNALTGSGTTTLSPDDLIEAFSNLSLVNPANTNDGCAVANTVIQWGPSVAHTDSVILNGLVSWVWADGNPHSVSINGASPVLVGFGSGNQSLARTRGCLVSDAATPSGGVPCNLAASGNFTYSQFFLNDGVITYGDAVHAGLTGTLTVGGGTGTGGNTNTNPADVTDVSPDITSIGPGSAASKLWSWF